MTLFNSFESKESGLSPNMFELEISQEEVKNLVRGLVFEQKNIFLRKKNTSSKHKLVHLLQNMSNNDHGNGESVL